MKNFYKSAFADLTNCWFLDVEYLFNLIQKHDLDFSKIVDNVKMNFWEKFICDINYLIYEALYFIACKFIDTNKNLFKDESDEFEIYTNFLDSHIYFKSSKVNKEFERFF